MRKVRWLVLLLVLGALALPVSNLIVGLPESALARAKVEDPLHGKALQVLGRKCANCHTDEPALPFYAKLPVAKGIVQADMEKGTAWMDYVTEMLPPAGTPVSEVALAKTEHVLEAGGMPPVKYLLLHWNGGLSAEERADVLKFVREHRKAHYGTPGVAEAYAADPVQPLPLSVDLPPEKVALGEKMFHDKRLSRDETLSCASCHDLGRGGCDQERYAKGVGGAMGGINSPTVFNSSYGVRQFWDGRAADLVEQAAGPVENPIEMAAKWDEVVAKLDADGALKAEFASIYPDGLTRANVLDAIATFEKSLITPNSPLDKFLRGDEAALGPEAREGYALFLDKGCAACHVGAALGGRSFEKMGRAGDYFEARGNPTDADLGRFSATKKECDRHCFKVPTLRNVALTFPYFHDGTVKDLAEAVKAMGRCELGGALTGDEVAKIVALLKALTGEHRGQPLR